MCALADDQAEEDPCRRSRSPCPHIVRFRCRPQRWVRSRAPTVGRPGALRVAGHCARESGGGTVPPRRRRSRIRRAAFSARSFPGGPPHSPPRLTESFEHHARDCGMRLLCLVPDLLVVRVIGGLTSKFMPTKASARYGCVSESLSKLLTAQWSSTKTVGHRATGDRRTPRVVRPGMTAGRCGTTTGRPPPCSTQGRGRQKPPAPHRLHREDACSRTARSIRSSGTPLPSAA